MHFFLFDLIAGNCINWNRHAEQCDVPTHTVNLCIVGRCMNCTITDRCHGQQTQNTTKSHPQESVTRGATNPHTKTKIHWQLNDGPK